MNDTRSTAANALLAKVAVNRKVMADPAVVAATAARIAAREVLEQAIGEGAIGTLALSSPTEPPMAASAREFEDAARILHRAAESALSAAIRHTRAKYSHAESVLAQHGA